MNLYELFWAKQECYGPWDFWRHSWRQYDRSTYYRWHYVARKKYIRGRLLGLSVSRYE